MTSPEDIERRLKAAESDAAAARVLAAGADRDCSEMKAELRSHTTVLNAVRETQVEQGKTLAGHGQILAGHSQILAGHSKTLAEHGQILAGHSRILAEHSKTLAEHGQAIARLEKTVNEGFAKTEQQFAKVGQGMAHIVGLLEKPSAAPPQQPHPPHGQPS